MNNIFDWPVFALCDDIRLEMGKLVAKKQKFAIATLAEAEGSSPRPIGSQMLVSDDREVFGYVSGGCVESNLAELAIEAIKNNQPRFLTFGYGSSYIDIKLLCGKKIDIALDVFEPDDKAVMKVLEFTKQRKAFYLLGNIAKKEHFCFSSQETSQIPSDLKLVLNQASGIKNDYYWKYFTPNLRLVINGSNPVTMAILRLAGNMGWEVVLNREYGSPLPAEVKVDYYCQNNGEKLFKEFEPDEMTAVISLTHDLEADNDIIKYALPSKAFYVGVLGSRKHLPKREQMLKEDNIEDKAVLRLKAPIGLDLGSATANEIAIAIISDIIKNFRLS